MKPEDFKYYNRHLLTDAGEIDRGLSTTEHRMAKIAKAILENVAPADAMPLDSVQLRRSSEGSPAFQSHR